MLQSLPSTRQRHSLLTFGKNLLNMPDDEPEINLVCGSRKRHSPDSGFGMARASPTKIARTQSDGNMQALNLVKNEFRFAIPSPAGHTMKRMNSMTDISQLSNSPTTQRLLKLRPVQTITNSQTQRQLFKSPANSRDGILSPGATAQFGTPTGGLSLLKKALNTPPHHSMQQQQQGPVRIIQLSPRNRVTTIGRKVIESGRNVHMKLVGLDNNSSSSIVGGNGKPCVTLLQPDRLYRTNSM